jgi:ABC-type taurine transport system ATPase subunit
LKWRTIIDNVLLPAEILGLPAKESRERARDLLALVGLGGAEDAVPLGLVTVVSAAVAAGVYLTSIRRNQSPPRVSLHPAGPE